jgi:SAM-dependent methyltransferase
MTSWDGDDYQRRIAERVAGLDDPHGEVAFVQRFAPRRVLDAGCGTGRVAIELARRGVEVVGADVDPSMLRTARRLAPEVPWIEADLAALDLDETFDVVVMAGNVPLFTPAGTTRAIVAGCARHLAPGGHLVTGFQLRGGAATGRYGAADLDADAAAAGLEPVVRYATWEATPAGPDDDYVVAVHRRPVAPLPRSTS